mmetsp:Transcript_15946/g.41249  ORF Transcript_15946/g.41249 Transcript_15946/m.41249 type:complete len:390 (-) Transcript_15946:110-1279(-)
MATTRLLRESIPFHTSPKEPVPTMYCGRYLAKSPPLSRLAPTMGESGARSACNLTVLSANKAAEPGCTGEAATALVSTALFAAAAAAVPGAVVATTGLQWEVRTDSGWRAYRPEHSTTISDGVRRGAPRVKLNIETGTGFTDYFITLQAPRFEQVRADGSGWPREVRSVSTGGNAWEIKTDEGWRPYSPEHSAEISAAVALGKASLTLVIITGTGPTPYVIDLASQPYRQVRSDGTGAPRELRRRQIAYTGGAAPPPSTPTIGAAADIPPPYVGQPPQADPAPTPAAAVAAAAADAGAGQDKPQPKDPRPSAPPVSPPPIPNDLLCPISMELLDDPVVAADGYTYEREVIEEWLKKNDTSPMTNVKLDHKMLVPNKTIKALIASAGYAD